MSEVFEQKYLVPRRSRDRLLAHLRFFMVRPPQYSYSRLLTHYYDDRNWTSYWESRDGTFAKTKFRFRCYIDPDGGAYHSIELKKKMANRTSKTKTFLFAPLKGFDESLGFHQLLTLIEQQQGISLSSIKSELPQNSLRHVAAISYERHRFDSPQGDVRFNLDTHVSIYRGPSTVSQARHPLPHDIFEIKSARELPHLPQLRDLHLEHFSFSKFAWGLFDKYKGQEDAIIPF